MIEGLADRVSVLRMSRRVNGSAFEYRGTEIIAARVLDILSTSPEPLGACAILERPRLHGRHDPPTVYRGLARPVQRRMAHRLETLKAYVARRSEPTHTTEASRDISALYTVCDRCRSVHEVDDSGLKQVIDRCATEANFTLRAGMIEVLGLCADCCDCKDTTAEREAHDGSPDRNSCGVVL